MPDTKLKQPPLTRDVEVTPPAPSDAEPRTEHHDWLFVGYNADPKRNDPPLALWVTEPADLPRAVEAFEAREAEGQRYPFIFLAPALGAAFEERAARALVAAAKREGEPPWPALAWDMIVDFTPSDAAWAEYDRIVAMYGDDNPSARAAFDSSDAAERQQISAMFAQVPGLDPTARQQITGWLNETMIVSSRDRFPLRRGTVEAILAAGFRAQLHARLFAAEQPAGGWQIVLIEPNRVRLEQTSQSFMRTPDGTRLRTEMAYRALLSAEEILPVAADRLVGFIADHHEKHSESCDELPTKRQIAAFMKQEGIRDPAPAAAIAPTAATLLAERGMAQPPAPIAVLPYLAWGGRLSLLAAREKDGKSTLVGGAVAALTQGASWLGQPCAPVGPVLWLHEESPDDVVGRLQQFGADLSRVHLLQLPRPEAARDLSANVARLKPVLVIVDSLIRYTGGRVTDPTRATQWEPIMSELLGLAQKSGAAIMVLHHAGKKDGEYRDSTEIGAGVDMLIQMPGGLKGNRQRLEAKGRIIGVAPYEITVELVGTTHRLVGGDRAEAAKAPAAAISDQDRAVLDALVGTMRYSEWFEASGLRSKRRFDGIRERLVAAGAVEKTKDGQYRTR
jgi:hypothetical protein